MKWLTWSSILLVGCAMFSSCYTPHAPEGLPAYGADSPAIDNENWGGTNNQAEWKERPGVNQDILHQAITGRHSPVSPY